LLCSLMLVILGLGLAACAGNGGDTTSSPSSTTAATTASTTTADLSTTSSQPPPTPEPAMSVMSFNVRYDTPDDEPSWNARLPAILEMLQTRQPDIVGTQEALDHQVRGLAAGLGDYDWTGVGRDDGDAAGEYAAIFYKRSRLELLDSGTSWLSESPDVPSRGWDAALERIVTWAELRLIGSNESFYVFNTHFDHEGRVAREESAKLIAELVDARAGEHPVFVVGDLNVLPTDRVLDPLLAELTDMREASPVTDDIGSFNAFREPLGLWSIDYVLARKRGAGRV